MFFWDMKVSPFSHLSCAYDFFCSKDFVFLYQHTSFVMAYCYSEKSALIAIFCKKLFLPLLFCWFTFFHCQCVTTTNFLFFIFFLFLYFIFVFAGFENVIFKGFLRCIRGHLLCSLWTTSTLAVNKYTRCGHLLCSPWTSAVFAVDICCVRCGHLLCSPWTSAVFAVDIKYTGCDIHGNTETVCTRSAPCRAT